MTVFWKRLDRWDRRRWWWLLLLAITIGNVIRGTDSWWIAVLAFVAGAAFEKRFLRKRRPSSRSVETGFPPMPGPLAPRSRAVPPYPDKGVEL